MRIVTPEEAVAGIRSRDQIYLQCAAATPSVLLDALVARAPELHDVSVVHLHCEGPGPHLAPEMAPHFRHRALFIGPNARRAVNEGRADFVPVFLSDVPALFRTRALPLDAVFVNATPPDAHGFCSLGVSVEAMHAAIDAATTVIVQFNRSMPRTLGESFVHVSQIDLAVEVDQPPYEHARPEIGDLERRIGSFIADLIPDGATLQLGIGAIPAATAQLLTGKRDLGIHSEMFTDAVVDLVEAGAVTGDRKARNRGKLVVAFLMGTRKLYDFANDNPMLEMRSVDFTNDTHVIRSFDNMVAINSAIEVDLSGQVVADFDRVQDVLGDRRADGLHAWSGPGRRRPADHRPAVNGRIGWRGVPDHVLAQGRGRRRHDPGPRPDGGDGMGRRRAVGEEPSRASQGAHRDRTSRPPRPADGRGAPAPRAVARPAPRGPEKEEPPPHGEGQGFGWAPGVPSGTHLTRSVVERRVNP